MATISDRLSRATDSSTGRPVIAKLASAKAVAAPTISITVATNWTTTSVIYFAIYTLTAAGTKDPTSQTDWKGILTGTTISNMTLTGGTDRTYTTDAYVEQTFTAGQLKDQYDHAKQQHDDAGVHTVAAATTLAPLFPTNSINSTSLKGAKVERRDNTVNTTEATAKIQSGWLAVQGAGTANATASVTFPVAFTGIPIVIATFGGDSAATTSTLGSGTAAVNGGSANARSVTATTFSATAIAASGTWSATNTIYIHWIAIGI